MTNENLHQCFFYKKNTIVYMTMRTCIKFFLKIKLLFMWLMKTCIDVSTKKIGYSIFILYIRTFCLTKKNNIIFILLAKSVILVSSLLFSCLGQWFISNYQQILIKHEWTSQLRVLFLCTIPFKVLALNFL